MKLKNYLAGILLVMSLCANAQCPATAITLSNQTAVDNFAANFPGCNILPEGIDLVITGNSITNLDGLSVLTGALGPIEIRSNPNLVSIAGLSNLAFAGSDFIIRSNASLQRLDGLQNLQTIGGEFTIRSNQNLTDITALSALTAASLDVIIRDNDALESLSGLENLLTVGGILEIVENGTLTDISALANIATITGGEEGAVVIEANPLLTSLEGLGNANTTISGDLILQGNESLTHCAVESICKYFSAPPANAVTLVALNNTGCNSVPEIQAFCPALEVADIQNSRFSFFPNPADGFLNVANDRPDPVKITIYNSSGNAIKNDTIPTGLTRFSIEGLASGLYLLSFDDGEMRVNKKLIVR